MATFLKDLRVNEVSSVDRGAGEGVKMMLMKRAGAEPYWKRKFDAETRRQMASSGAAMSDGSFPIANKEDLENAIRDYGRAADPEKAKAHIINRARSIHALDTLPDTWEVSKGEASMTDEEKKAKAKAEADAKEEAAEKAKSEKEAKKALAKAFVEFGKMSAKHKEFAANLNEEDNGDFLAMTPAEREKYISDNPDPDQTATPKVKKLLADAAADRVQLQKLLEERDVVSFGKRAVGLGIEESHGETLRKAYQGDAAAIGKLETLIKGMAEQIRTGKVFEEFGSAQKGAAATAKGEMQAKVDEMRKANPKLSQAQAFDKVYTDRANVDLKKRFDAEDAAARHRAA